MIVVLKGQTIEKCAIFLLAAVVATAENGCTQKPSQYVAMISIDGLRPIEYLQQTSHCGTLPNLTELMQSGVYAEGMAGVLPTVTYPAHATIVTGMTPAKHGVLTNERLRDGSWNYDRADIHATTLWDVAQRAGLSVAIVTWPSSYGADVKYLIPENLSPVENVTDLVKAGSTHGLFESLEAATSSVHLLSFTNPEAGIPLDRMTASFSAEIVRRYKPDLLLLHFLDFDHRQHTNGPGSPEACQSLLRLDGFVGEVRAAYRTAGILNRTAFFVVSDHGFFPLQTQINLATMFATTGWTMSGKIESRTSGGSAAFYSTTADDQALVDWLERDLRPRVEFRFRDKLRWMTREEAQNLGGFTGSAFILCARPGYSFAPTASPDELFAASRLRGMHGHCPDESGVDASFIASGAGIQKAGAISRIRMIDVAPTIAALLGIELRDAEGRVVPEVLE